jgi:SulP family sulfate permease
MRHVQSLDYTAAHMFEQMNSQLAEREGQLLFSGMPSALFDQRNFELYLVQLGIVREKEGVMISETLDSALEWMEERILKSAGVKRSDEEQLLDLRDFNLFRKFDEETIKALGTCLEERSLAPGEAVFAKGDKGDELFLVRRGSIRILLPLEGGKRHHVATVGRGDFFGELSFLDRGVRSADAEAKVATDLYVLSRSRFNAESLSTPSMGVQVFARLAIAITERLRRTNSELRIFVER